MQNNKIPSYINPKATSSTQKSTKCNITNQKSQNLNTKYLKITTPEKHKTAIQTTKPTPTAKDPK